MVRSAEETYYAWLLPGGAYRLRKRVDLRQIVGVVSLDNEPVSDVRP